MPARRDVCTLPSLLLQPYKDYELSPKVCLPLYKTSLRAGILSTAGAVHNFVLYVALSEGGNENGYSEWLCCAC
jgi:hypothetical protein